MQLTVSVDHVVGTATFQHVAARAADQDVAGPPRGGTRRQDGRKATDPGDAGHSQVVATDHRPCQQVCWHDAVASNGVVECAAGQRLDQQEAVAGIDRVPHCQQQVRQVEVDPDAVALIGDTCRLPVEPCRTVDAVETRAADGDVVAALAVETVIARLAEENVVPRTLQFVQEERAATVAAEAVALVAALQPVVAAIALHRVAAQPGHDEVVARAGEGLIGVRSAVGEVAAVAAEHDVQARARADHVVARTTRRDVVAIAVGDEVAALAAQRHIGAGPTFDDIVAQPTPEGVAVVAARCAVGVVGAVVHRLAIDSRRIDAVGELVLDGAIG